MRSSKSRSRNKNNRNRSVGNIVNRVFDSSGPEGKVRGTPQQVIEKYNQLARDAQLAGDRVATENFQQHAEHYTRMLSVAQKEADAKREQQEAQQQQQQQRDQQQRDRQQQNHNQNNQNTQNNQNQQQDAQGGDDTPSQQQHSKPERQDRQPQPHAAADTPRDDVIDTGSSASGGLVSTPEEGDKPAKKPRTRRKAAKPKTDEGGASDADTVSEPSAAE